jgi:hypothetical protein
VLHKPDKLISYRQCELGNEADHDTETFRLALREWKIIGKRSRLPRFTVMGLMRSANGSGRCALCD